MQLKELSNNQLYSLVILRILIGWHLLYEGFTKFYSSSWSAKGYLLSSQGLFEGFFKYIGSNDTLLAIGDFLNVWGLMLIGLLLILGLFSRGAAIAGMILIGTYYLSHPPFSGLDYSIPSEGNYIIVDKNLIEIAALWVIVLFPTTKAIGLERLIFKKQ